MKVFQSRPWKKSSSNADPSLCSGLVVTSSPFLTSFSVKAFLMGYNVWGPGTEN